MVRRNRWSALAAGCALLGLSAGASAADMPLKAPARVAPVTGNWSGLYGGIHGGWGRGDADYVFDPYATMGIPFAPIVAGGAFEQKLDGGLFGAHLGYNRQVGSWVFGLEASLAWSGIDGASVDVFIPSPNVVPGNTYATRLKWLATLTPRLGYAAQNWLFYVKGGLAAGEVESTLTGVGLMPPATAEFFQERNDHAGWALGLGVEYAWTPNWILGVEYSYIDLGNQFYGGTQQGPGFAITVGEYSADITFSTVMARLSYKPDAPAGVAAFAADAPAHAAGWSGFYAGVHGGWGWGDANYAFTPTRNGSTGGGLNGWFSPARGGAFSQSLDSGLFGGHLGFNAQRGAWLFGLEGSLTRSGLKGQSVDALPNPQPGTAIYDTELTWLAMLTPRLGYAAGNWLLYAKGGLAAGRVTSKLSNVALQGKPFEETNYYIGWTLGAGIEYAWHPNWTLGVEYNYADLGRQHYGSFAYIDTVACCLDYDVDLTISTVLARLSYRWGGR